MTAMDQTEKAADRIRSELLLTLEEIDRRRQRATDLRALARDHVPGLVALGAALGVLAAAMAVVVRVRAHSRRTIAFRDRARALMRAWEHPNRVASNARYRPVAAELVRKALMAAATVAIQRAVAEAGRRVATPAPSLQ